MQDAINRAGEQHDKQLSGRTSEGSAELKGFLLLFFFQSRCQSEVFSLARVPPEVSIPRNESHQMKITHDERNKSENKLLSYKMYSLHISPAVSIIYMVTFDFLDDLWCLSRDLFNGAAEINTWRINRSHWELRHLLFTIHWNLSCT